MPKEHIQPLQAYQLLPRTNCKQCGKAGCLAFAMALITREKIPADCPPLLEEKWRRNYERLKQYFGETLLDVAKTGLLINTELCNGCGDCVVVCDKAITTMVLVGTGQIIRRPDLPENPESVLLIEDGVLKVINWNVCKRCMKPPDWCRLCEIKCPFGALELVK